MLTSDETATCTAILCVALEDGSRIGRVAPPEAARLAAAASAAAPEVLV